MITKTVHGVIHGKTIELDEDLGVSEGQSVEVQVKIVDSTKASQSEMSAGLVNAYEILGRQHNSGHTDTAERHDEHQP
jgi:hypothetical protein